MSALDNLLNAAEAFAAEKFDAMDDDEREAIAAALSRGCHIELRLCATAESRVRLLLLTPDCKHELPIGRLVEQRVSH